MASAVVNPIIISPTPSSSNGHGHQPHHHHHVEYNPVSIVASSSSKDGGFKRGEMVAHHPSLDHHYANLLFNGTTATSSHQFQNSSSTNCQKMHLGAQQLDCQQQQLPAPSLSQLSSFSSLTSSSASSSSQSSSFSAYLSSPSSSSSSQSSIYKQSNYNHNIPKYENSKRFTPKACSSIQSTPSPNSSKISKLNQVIKLKKQQQQGNEHTECNYKKKISYQSTDHVDDGNESDAENYERISRIGEGTYGVVFKARDLRSKDNAHNTTNEVVAMKRVTVPLYEEEGIPVTLLREISLLKSLENYSHPNIVKLLDICTGKRLRKEAFYLYLIFEHVEQDLASYLSNCPSPGLCPSRIKEVTYFILKGIDFLHSNRIVHRDLKPSNVLVAKSGQIKLADFGLARIYESSVSLTTTVVTLWYRSPEVLLCTSYASTIDIWSIGCIFAELFTRRALIPGNSEAEQLQKIFQVIGSPPMKDWPEDCTIKYEMVSKFKPTPIETLVPNICSQGSVLIMKMLTFNPKERISAKDALNSDYFDEYGNHPPYYEERELSFDQEIKKKHINALLTKKTYRRKSDDCSNCPRS